jgi:hypothetical protein
LHTGKGRRTAEVLQDLDLALDLLLLHWLEDLDDALLLRLAVHALKHLAVLPAPNLRIESRKSAAHPLYPIDMMSLPLATLIYVWR